MDIRNICSIAFLLISLVFFIAATSINESATMGIGNCFHCGSESACSDGGQEYGWTACWLDESAPPPYNCNVHGSSECGALNQ